jgi:hypothetical protein
MPVCTTQGSTAGLSRRPAKYRAKKTKGLEPHPKTVWIQFQGQQEPTKRK